MVMSSLKLIVSKIPKRSLAQMIFVNFPEILSTDGYEFLKILIVSKIPKRSLAQMMVMSSLKTNS